MLFVDKMGVYPEDTRWGVSEVSNPILCFVYTKHKRRHKMSSYLVLRLRLAKPKPARILNPMAVSAIELLSPVVGNVVCSCCG